MRRLTRGDRVFLAAGAALAVFSALWLAGAYALGGRSDFFRRAALFLGGLLRKISGLVPLVPAAELVWICGIAGCAAVLAVMAVRRGVWGIMGWLCRVAFALGLIFLSGAALYFPFFFGPTLAESMGLPAEGHSAAELARAAETVVGELRETSALVERDGDGIYLSPSFERTASEVMKSYSEGSLSRFYRRGPMAAPREAVILSKPMAYLGLTGYFFSPTCESIVGAHLANASQPFTAAHELAHAFGVCREKEANFAAFVCCRESADPQTRYSGLLNGYILLNNALYRKDPQAWKRVYGSLPDEVKADISRKNEDLRRYEGPVRDLGERVNDAAIRATGQQEGVESYGLAADLIIEWVLRG